LAQTQESNDVTAPDRALAVVFAAPGRVELEGFGRVLDHLRAGRLRLAPLISHRLPAPRAPEAFALLRERPDDVLGMILDWR
jgi:threonine dehydrogenase-like Zn-dependent dehydrogenase